MKLQSSLVYFKYPETRVLFISSREGFPPLLQLPYRLSAPPPTLLTFSECSSKEYFKRKKIILQEKNLKHKKRILSINFIFDPTFFLIATYKMLWLYNTNFNWRRKKKSVSCKTCRYWIFKDYFITLSLQSPKTHLTESWRKLETV